MATVLVIDDERDIAELIAFNLEKEGYKTLEAADGLEGLEVASSAVPDLIILDLMLPNILGTEVCKMLKRSEKTSQIPVIMLTAKGEEIDRVVGFEVGAEDYVVKPFSMRELILRVKVLLRRSSTAPAPANTFTAGPITVDVARCAVFVDGEETTLTSTEFKLLHTLMTRMGRVQSRDVLLRDVWGYHYVEDTRTVDTHVTRLRTKMGEAGNLIKTVRGFGYKIEGTP